MKFILLLLPIFFVLLGCKQHNSAAELEPSDAIISEVIIGRIDSKFFEEVKSRKPETNTLIVMSRGGNTNFGLKVAYEILSNKLDVTIAEICLSACAEYILPAANNIHLIDEPLIGYHWNPIILGSLLRNNAAKDIEYCTEVGDEQLLKLLSDAQKKTDAWKQTLKRIKIKNYIVEYQDKACPWSVKEFENKYWFPTSQQLEHLFGVHVTGDLCADNEECYKKKLEHYYKRTGGSFIVGDTKIIITKKIK